MHGTSPRSGVGHKRIRPRTGDDLHGCPSGHQMDGIGLASDEPGPGQTHAVQARKHIATLRRTRPDITIEIRWCAAHKGIAGNEKADEWAKTAAEKPGTRGVEYLAPLPRSLSNLKREISEKKWAEARQWAGSRTSNAKYRLPKSQKPGGTVADSTKRLAEPLGSTS